MTMYYAICTPIRTLDGDPYDFGFTSENFFEAVSFCVKRDGKLEAAIIVEERNGKEREIVSFRTVR